MTSMCSTLVNGCYCSKVTVQLTNTSGSTTGESAWLLHLVTDSRRDAEMRILYSHGGVRKINAISVKSGQRTG